MLVKRQKRNIIQIFYWNEQEWMKRRMNGLIMFLGSSFSLGFMLSGRKWTGIILIALTLLSMFNARFKEDVIDRTLEW